MADVLYLIIPLAFFALATGFVRVCDRIIGPDPTPTGADPDGPFADVDRNRTDPLEIGATK